MAKETGEIQIAAELQMDPFVCKFVVDRKVYEGFYNCRSKAMAEGSPLLEALFGIPDISEVLISGSTLTIKKAGDDDWPVLAKKIGMVLREKMAAGGPMIAPDVEKKGPAVKDLQKRIKEVFETEINPGLASHGGSVELMDIQGTTVYLTMSGGCQGCASAGITLRNGIEQILRSRVPEVTEIVDVTDHGAGDSPYF
ncbi:MAG: hypothetical protein GY841_19315 [FCB group bacterium]|nr:hypothetical protein [FCB group bacterium]